MKLLISTNHLRAGRTVAGKIVALFPLVGDRLLALLTVPVISLSHSIEAIFFDHNILLFNHVVLL